MLHTRPANYVERRVDGYEEPLEVFVLGTCHYSEKSARDAARVIRSIQPQNVVIELCRSRTSMLAEIDEDSSQQACLPNGCSKNCHSLQSFGLRPCDYILDIALAAMPALAQ